MTSYTVSYGFGRILAGQNDAIWLPRGGPRGKRAVVLCHGQLQTTAYWLIPGSPGQFSIPALLAGAGLVVIASDLDGPAWGNAQAVSDIDACRAYAGTLGCATDKILLGGASMGADDCFMYMAAHPSRVAAMWGVIPANDLNDIRDNNRGGNTQANINTAWGLPAGSTSATVPLPSGSNPSDPAVAAAIATSGPIQLCYSTADAIVVPQTVEAFADLIGPSCSITIADTVSGHTDTTMGAAAALAGNPATANRMCQFLVAHA